MRGVVLALVLCAAPLVALGDSDPAAPPANILPTTMTLKGLLALHAAAEGHFPAGTAGTRLETRTYTDGSLTGTQTLVVADKNYREDTTLGPFHSAEGRLNGRSWRQNRNGLTRSYSNVHERDDVNAYALAHPFGKESGVTLIGEVAVPSRAYVIKINPKGGRVEYAFYDASTYLVVRDESAYEGRRVVDTYDDFRVTSGVKEAWHRHESDGLPGNDKDWKTQSLAWGANIEPSQLTIPPSSRSVTLSGDHVALPAKISGDRVILTVRIGSHKVNLQLDSGASGILLNRAVADATGVTSYGQKIQTTAGQYLASDALVPGIDFGSAHMQNVAAQTGPYAQETYEGAPVAGLIGYDFIAGSVVHIDYFNGKVEAIAPASFSAPPGAVAIPIRLDDGVPVIDAKIGNTTGHDFVVDTGADRSMLFSAFADAHPAAIADQGLGESRTASFPFIGHILGVGGKVEVRPVQVSLLSIGSIQLPDWLFEVSSNAPSFEGEDYDGLIGQDVLRNFDVYFDYEHAMMYLSPNERYRQRWGLP